MLKGSAEVAVTENRKHKHKQERKKKKINQNCFIYAFFIQDKIPTRWVLLIKKYAKSNRSLSIRFFTAISNNSRPDTQSTLSITIKKLIFFCYFIEIITTKTPTSQVPNGEDFWFCHVQKWYRNDSVSSICYLYQKHHWLSNSYGCP